MCDGHRPPEVPQRRGVEGDSGQARCPRGGPTCPPCGAGSQWPICCCSGPSVLGAKGGFTFHADAAGCASEGSASGALNRARRSCACPRRRELQRCCVAACGRGPASCEAGREEGRIGGESAAAALRPVSGDERGVGRERETPRDSARRNRRRRAHVRRKASTGVQPLRRAGEGCPGGFAAATSWARSPGRVRPRAARDCCAVGADQGEGRPLHC